MDALFVVTSSLFFLWVVRSTFYWLTLWQEFQYRPDRFFRFLFQRKQLLHLFGFPATAFKILLLIGFAITIFVDNMLFIYQDFIVVLYFLQFFLIVRELGMGSFKKPVLSLKNKFIMLLVFSSVFFLYSFPLVDKFFWLLLLDFAIPLLVAFFIFVFLFPTELYADWQTEKAEKKIRFQKELTVIALTGSVGKSSTKLVLTQLLGKRYKVVSTPANDTALSQIAKTIADQVKSDTELLLVELNAYTKGDIARICRLIHPNIAVVTPITTRSLAYFKDMESCKQANYELVEAVPRSGLVLFAFDSPHTRDLFLKTKKHKAYYGVFSTADGEGFGVDGVIATDIRKQESRVAFTAYISGKKYRLHIPSAYHIEHVLPALYICRYLGMSMREIQMMLQSIKPHI